MSDTADDAIAEMDRIRERARELAVAWVLKNEPALWVAFLSTAAEAVAAEREAAK